MSKVEKQKRRIIVKIIRKSEHGPRKGIWKVAYADFVTAMMAFFLLLWLITVSSKTDLMGVGEYFRRPVRVAFLGGKTDDEDTSIMGQGGRDLTRTSGEVARTADLAAAQKEMQRLEIESLQQLKIRIEKAMEADPAMLGFRHQLLIDITANGLRIQIVDDRNRPMFDRGSAILQPYAIEILHAIGKMLNTVTNRISLSGHTDA
ncbi:MAG: flagellar motor protein MotB, partial [Burkholderiales bacterium]